MRRFGGVSSACALASWLGASSAWAAASAATPAGSGQQALAVEVSASGVRANACASGACAATGGKALEVPEAAKRLLGGAKATVVELENGRKLVHVLAPDGGGAAWEALVAAPLAGQPTEPSVLWSGFTGAPRGDTGEEKAGAIVVEPVARGSRVIVGERQQDVTICGRPAIVKARSVDPATLAFARFASVQSLGEKDRRDAKPLAATALPAPPAPLPLRFLRTGVASSSVTPTGGLLNDGNLDTSWSEAKVGEGRGEFVTFIAASDVPITALDLVVRPGVDVPHGVAPRTVYVATDDRLFHVTLPSDGWRAAKSSFSITFPEPIKTACLAVVLDDTFGGKGDKEARTTLTEVAARTPFDGISIESLVGALAGGGERARGAGAMLERGGAPAATAAIAAYEKLDDLGRELARRVIDGGPCSQRAVFYEKRFAEAVARGKTKGAAPGDIDPDYSHAIHQLGTACKSDGAGAYVRLLGSPNERVRTAAAAELVVVAPAQAIAPLLDAFTTAKPGVKTELVGALSSAARSPRAKNAVALELEPARLRARPEPVRIALLRAVGPELSKIEGGADAFAALAVPNADFATRWLLQGPASELARSGNANAAAFLEASLLRDADPHVRARAAEVGKKVPALAPQLARAVDDPDVRVREAAIGALSDAPGPAAQPIARRLATDDWTFVRSAAARALGALPAGPAVDAALAAALADTAPDVRGHALDSLGRHQATAYAPKVRELAENERESPDVRAHAIGALGELCDRKSIPALTKLAQRAKQPFDEIGRRLGPPAIAALGAIHPADLDARLAPLLDKDAHGPIRELARAAKSMAPRCVNVARIQTTYAAR